MTEYTAAKDALLMALASAIIGGQVDSVALHGLKQVAQGAKPSPAEPKPSAGLEDEKTERNKRVLARWDELTCKGKHGYYELLFHVVREEVERTAAAKDSALAAVIADNDEKMAEIEGLKKALKHWETEFYEEIDKCGDAIEVLKKENGDLLKNIEHWRHEVGAKQSRIDTLKHEQAMQADLVSRLNDDIQALRHPDIKAAAKRAYEAWLGSHTLVWIAVACAALNAPENGAIKQLDAARSALGEDEMFAEVGDDV